MTHAHNEAFCRGIAQSIKGERAQAAAYVEHGPSIGTLRERIVRNLLVRETPRRFEVDTGFIINSSVSKKSLQCDILIHDTWQGAPVYRYNDFVIVDQRFAKMAIEVKSKLYEKEFSNIVNVTAKNVNVSDGHKIPTFGYGLTGATFESIAKYIADATKSEGHLCESSQSSGINKWPVGIVVQDRSIFGINATDGMPGHPRGKLPDAFCLLDLTKGNEIWLDEPNGIETGLFLHFYSQLISQNGRFPLIKQWMYEWFNRFPVSDDGKIWVDAGGNIHNGKIS